MSLIISVYCNEGIVLASESRVTQTVRKRSFPFSDNAHKTFETPNGYGISTCGAASINGQPIAGYVGRFVETYDYKNANVKQFTEKLGEAFSIKGYDGLLIFHVAGYDRDANGVSIERLYRLVLDSGTVKVLEEITDGVFSGAVWDGMTEILTRLIKGVVIPSAIDLVDDLVFTNEGTTKSLPSAYVVPKEGSSCFPESTISWGLFSLQDAIDFARFGIRTTIDAQRFLSTEKTVGGPIDIMVIRPDGIKWISQKVLK